jgi:NAD(P)H-hydrate epimerase
MRPVITPEESARLDAAAADRIPELMERAGLATALAAVDMGAGYGNRVVVLAGKGNNGGDGYVAAKYLRRRGAAVEVHALGYPGGEHSPARQAAMAAVRAGVRVQPLATTVDADLVIDALFGVGFHGELPPEVMPWLAHPAPVLAVDVPSGLHAADGAADQAFHAEITVTFHALKVGHLLNRGPELCGRVLVRDIGLSGGDPAFVLVDAADAPLPRRGVHEHKWSAGSVLVVGGSPGLTGAAVLAGRSALAAGAGAVAIACPARLQPAIEALAAGVMTAGFGESDRFDPADADDLLAYAERFDVIALGPGLGANQAKFVAELLARWPRPVVLDADGINASTVAVLADRDGESIVTPHAGEFRRLTGSEAHYQAAAGLAAEIDGVVVLKGFPTFVASRDDFLWAVDSGGPELATIGTGDVLTGMIAALRAAGLSGPVAARSGAFWHGRAGAELRLETNVTAELLAARIGERS